MNALQLITDFPSLSDAEQALDAILYQDGIIGARVLPAAQGERDRLQAIFEDDLPISAALPDGMRRVIMPEGFTHRLAPARKLALEGIIEANQALLDVGRKTTR